MQKLEAAFRTNPPIAPDTAAVYYEHLKRVDDKAFEKAVTTIIQRDTFFPPIARIIEALGTAWTPDDVTRAVWF
jgi:hypothetical protein